MSVTYPADPLKPYGDRLEVQPLSDDRIDPNSRDDDLAEEPFVPVYARRGKAARGNGGKIPTWMILAPVGVIVVGGLGVLMMSNGEETAAPLSEPAATAPVVAATPLVDVAPVTRASTPAPVRAASTPAPALRQATPVRRAAAPTPARGPATPAAPRATPPAPVARAVRSSSTSTLNTAPTPGPVVTITPAPTPAQPPAPVIVVEPIS